MYVPEAWQSEMINESPVSVVEMSFCAEKSAVDWRIFSMEESAGSASSIRSTQFRSDKKAKKSRSFKGSGNCRGTA